MPIGNFLSWAYIVLGVGLLLCLTGAYRKAAIATSLSIIILLVLSRSGVLPWFIE